MKKVRIDWSKNQWLFWSGIPANAQTVRDVLIDWDKLPLGADVEFLLDGKKGVGKLMDDLEKGNAGANPDDGKIPPQGDPNRAKWIREHL